MYTYVNVAMGLTQWQSDLMFTEWTLFVPIGPFFAYHSVAWRLVCVLHLCVSLCVGILLWEYELGWWQVIAGGVWAFFVALQYTGLLETPSERHAFVVHLFSAISAINFVSGLPLSHNFLEFALEIRVCRYINVIGNLVAIGTFLLFFGFVVPNYAAWGCYPSRSPSSHSEGMCSTPPANGNACTFDLPWWAVLAGKQSVVCVAEDYTRGNPNINSCCEPVHTIYQEHGSYVIFGTKAIICSAGAYFIGIVLAWQTEAITAVEGEIEKKEM